MRQPTFISSLHYNPSVHYEIRMVKFTMKQLGLSDYAKQLRDIHERNVDRQYRLSFEAFADRFPTFPIRLMTKGDTSERKSAPHVTDGQIAWAMTRFKDSTLGRRFSDAKSAASAVRKGLAAGLIFPFGGVHGGWILHNGRFDTSINPPANIDQNIPRCGYIRAVFECPQIYQSKPLDAGFPTSSKVTGNY